MKQTAQGMMQRSEILELIRRYYPEGSERYKILVQHGEDVASLALEIAQSRPDLGLDVDFLYEASLLHDIGIYLTDAPGIDCHGCEAYIRHGYLGAELLRGLGLVRHAHVAERHTGAGLTAEDIRSQGLDLPEGIYMPQTPEEEVICYADKFYSKTKLGKRKTLERVRASMSRHGAEAVARFDCLHRKYGISGDDTLLLSCVSPGLARDL